MKLFKKMKGKQGFTLVEMLMVIGILTVLLAFAVPGVTSYTRRIRLMELDDSARSIFMAAQNRLVSLRSAGMSDLRFTSQKIEFENIPDSFKPRDVDGNIKEIDESSVDMRYVTREEITSEPNIIALGGDASNISSIEDSLLMNDFIIEYEANTGFVFGVFYCEDDGVLYELYNSKGSKDMVRDDFEQRLKDGGNIGYYGGGEVVESLPVANPQQKPKIEKSSAEKLALSIDFPLDYDQDRVYFTVSITGYDFRAYTDPANKEKYKHTVAIISKDDRCYIEKDKRGCTIILDSIAPGKSADTTDEDKDYYGWWLPKGTRYDAVVDGYNLSDWVIERDFKGWVYAGYFARKAWNTTGLDSNNGKLEDFYLLDSQGYFKHYVPKGTNSAYPYGGDVKEWNRWGYVYPVDCGGYEAGKEAINDGGHVTSQNPYVYYIIDPGSDITVEYSFYDITDGTIDIHGDPWTTNSYFEKLDRDAGVAYVSAGRHLQNLAFYTYYDLFKKAYITETIDFSLDHSGEPDCYHYWNSAETNKGTERATNLYDFVPIDNKFVNPSTAPDIVPDPNADSEIMIKYIRIDSTTYNDGKDETLDTFTESNHETTGFFTTAMNGEMAGLTFYCPVVIGGGQYTGTVIGKPADNGVHLKNVTVINPIVEGPGYVGGICGEWPSPEFSKNKILIEEVDNYFNNYKADYTERGYEGSITWGDPTNDPYFRFFIRGTDENSYAGGLIGYASDQVSNASAAVRVYSEGYAGGLIGRSNGSTFSNNYVGGHTYNGQFAGVLEDGTRYVLKNIYGAKGAGGLIGKVDDGRTITLNGAYSTCSVASEDSDKVDVMVGEGQYEPQSPSYAAGWVVDKDGKKITKTPRYGGELKPVKAEASNQVYCEPYDEYISLFYEKYPYFAQSSVHIGDWPVDPPIFGVFYWEKDSGNNIYYKALGYNAVLNEKIEKSTLKYGEIVITDFGYGYFYSSTVDSSEDLLKGIGTDADSSYVKSELEKYLADEKRVGCTLNAVAVSTKDSSVHTNQELSFTYDFGSRSGQKSYFFNPDFCGISESFDLGERKDSEEEPYKIRSEKQFENINNSLGSSYVQDLNISVSEHTPIGSLQKGYFSGKYDGNGYTVTVGELNVSESQGIGLFGVTRNADLENINAKLCSLNVENFGKKVGVGGIAGIAIGGNIRNCEVTGFNVSAKNNSADIAIGGIVGYSSANIENCLFGESGDKIAVDATSSSGCIVAVGGIAGSASGTISGTVSGGIGDPTSTCMVRYLDTELATNDKTDQTPNPTLIYAGGIVGNNVDFVGGTRLQVSECVSHATLRRGKIETVNDEKWHWNFLNKEYEPYTRTTLNGEIVISPIAPTTITITEDIYKREDLRLNNRTYSESIEDFGTYLLKYFGGNSASYITGSGVTADGNIDTTIINCSYYEGMNYYDSQLGGGNGANAIKPNGYQTPTLDDVNFYPPGYTPPPKTAEKPDVGIYSLYEKPDGSLYAKAYYSQDENISDMPKDDLDPLYKYGILVSLGRLDDSKLIITVSKNGAKETVKDIGRVYLGLDGKAILKSENGGAEQTYYEFSDYTFDEPGVYTVEASYDGEKLYTKTVTIPKRAPYVGIYELREIEIDGKQYIAGSYTDWEHVGERIEGDEKKYLANIMPYSDEDISADEFGIMIEHSVNKQFNVNNVEIRLNGSTVGANSFSIVGFAAYNDATGASPTVYGKKFDFYKLNKDVFESLAEGSEFTVEIAEKGVDGKLLARQTFTKEVKYPYIGIFGVKDGEPLTARVVYMKPGASKADIIIEDEAGIVSLLRYGVMLQEGFDVSKLTVELYNAAGKVVNTIDGSSLTAAASYQLVKGSGQTNKIDGIKYNVYKITDKLMENVYSIKLIYTAIEGKTREVIADIKDDFKSEPMGHKHVYDDKWESLNDQYHGRRCIDSDCNDPLGSLQKQEHTFRVSISEKPTDTEEGERTYTCTVCKYSKTEKFKGAPYVGIYAIYQKFTESEGSYTLGTEKYMALWLIGNDEIKALPAEGDYVRLTGEYGVVLGNGVDLNDLKIKKVNGGEYGKDKLSELGVNYPLISESTVSGVKFFELKDDAALQKGQTVLITFDSNEPAVSFDTSVFKEKIPENLSGGGSVERVGIYVKEKDADNPYNPNRNFLAWYPNSESEGVNNDGMTLCGEAGILVEKENLIYIQVYVDGVKVDADKLNEDSTVPYEVAHHWNDKTLTAYSIDKSVFGDKEEVTIAIKQGGKEIFSKKVRILEHTHKMKWSQPTGEQDTHYHYGVCVSEYCDVPGYTEKQEHNFDKGVPTVEATPENPTGTMKYTCTLCGYSYEEPYVYSSLCKGGVFMIYSDWNTNDPPYGMTAIMSDGSKIGTHRYQNRQKLGILIDGSLSLTDFTFKEAKYNKEIQNLTELNMDVENLADFDGYSAYIIDASYYNNLYDFSIEVYYKGELILTVSNGQF